MSVIVLIIVLLYNSLILKPLQIVFEVITNGVSQLFIDSAGKVGIGTSGPNQLLHLYQPDSNEVNIKITNDNTTNGLLLGLDTSNNFQIKQRENADVEIFTNDIERLRIKNDGNVGIGTTNPLEIMHINGSDGGAVQVRFTNADTTNGCNFGLDSGEGFVIRHRDNEQIKLYTADLQRLTIGSDGVIEPFTNNGIFKMVNLTTTERDAYSAENGFICYNTTTNTFQGYANGSWTNL